MFAIHVLYHTKQYNIRLIEKAPGDTVATGLHRQISNGE